MVIRKINLRKNAGTLTGVIISLILVIAFFNGMYFYWERNALDSGQGIASKYNSTSGNISSIQSDLTNNVDDIKSNVEGIREAESAYLAAWNGFKALGNTLKLPISFVTTAIATYTTLEYPLDMIPTWAKALALVGLTAFIVFLILAILKGEPKL